MSTNSGTGVHAGTATPLSSSSSSALANNTIARLGYFCVYNTDLGTTDETQHEQLLYYAARKTVSIDTKMRQIGLAQGLVNFARIFSPTAPCENVHSQKNRLVFYEPEPGFWMHMSIELGTVRKTIKGADGKQKILIEYMEHEIQDTVVSALLRQAYAMFKVSYGTMSGILEAHEGNPRPLQRRLEEFYEGWVMDWKIDRMMTLERALDGIDYLPLSRSSHLAIETLLQKVKERYPMITHTMVTFENQLVSTTIRDEDLKSVWKKVSQLTYVASATVAAAEAAALAAANLASGLSTPQHETDDNSSYSATTRKLKSTFKFGKSWSNTTLFGFYKPSAPSSPATSISGSRLATGSAATGNLNQHGSGSGTGGGGGGPLTPPSRPTASSTLVGGGGGGASTTTGPALHSPTSSIYSADGYSSSSARAGRLGAELDSARPNSSMGFSHDSQHDHHSNNAQRQGGQGHIGMPTPQTPMPTLIGGGGGANHTTVDGVHNNSGTEHSKTQISTMWFGQDKTCTEVEEYYGILYKNRNGLNITFFIPVGDDEDVANHHEAGLFLEMEEMLNSGQVMTGNSPTSSSTALVGNGGASLSETPISSSNGGGGLINIDSIVTQVGQDALTARTLGGVVSSDKEIRYLYFNRMNLAVKQSLGQFAPPLSSIPSNNSTTATSSSSSSSSGTAGGATGATAGMANGQSVTNSTAAAAAAVLSVASIGANLNPTSSPSTLSYATPPISGNGNGSSSSSKGSGAGGKVVLGSEMALALLDIKSDFDRMPDATEITTRSPTNHWIVGKRFDDREVYMIVSRKDSTLVEVEDEVRNLAQLYFNPNTLAASTST